MSNGRTFISWLDGRYSGQSKTHTGAHASSGMTLSAGIFSGEGEKTAVWELDDLVCDCCQTSSAMTGQGLWLSIETAPLRRFGTHTLLVWLMNNGRYPLPFMKITGR